MLFVDSSATLTRMRLGNCCSVQNGYPFKSEFYDKQFGIPLIRVRSLKEQNCDIYYNGPFDESYLVNNGDILIGMDGDFQPCCWQGGRALLNQRVCRLTNFLDTVEPYYIYEALKKPLKDLENTTYFTTVKHLSSFTVQEIQILLPPLPEQRAIAYVLQTVQQAIQTRCKELELERERKAALMQHLFTHGTRNEPTKQSEVGEIPESWTVVKLEKIAKLVSGGTPSKQRPEWWQGSIPWASPKGLKQPRLWDTQDHITQEALENGSCLIPAKTLLVVVRGMILAKNIPVAITETPMAFNQDIKAIIPFSEINADYLLYTLENYKSSLIRVIGTSAHGTKRVGTSSLENFLLPLPYSEEEQLDIANLIQANETKIAALEKEIALHEELFRAFLDELMTGRISTQPLVEELEKGTLTNGQRTPDGTGTTN